MTIINGVADIHPDLEIECEYCISANCLEESIANDRRFERVYNNDNDVTVIICHPCARMLVERGELVAIRSKTIPPTSNTVTYEFREFRIKLG